MIIDAHCHTFKDFGAYFPEKHVWYTAVHWAYKTVPPKDPHTVLPRISPGVSDPEGSYLVSDMDESGIDASVLLPLDYDLAIGQESSMSMDEKHLHLAYLQDKYPGRVFGFAGPDPRRTGALDLFEVAIKEHGLKGFKVTPNNGYYPYDELLYPFYAKCVEWDIPVLICTMCHSAPQHRSRFNNPLFIGDVLVDFPDLKVFIGHAGWPLWWEECLRVMNRAMNVYLECSLWHREVLGYAGRPAPSEKKFVEMLAQARDSIGAHRIVFGTDRQTGRRWSGDRALYGYSLKDWVDWWKRLPETAAKYGLHFSQEEVDLILGGNAARALGLDEQSNLSIPKFNYPIRRPRPSSAGV